MKFTIKGWMIRSLCACVLAIALAGPSLAQQDTIPQIRKTDGRYQFFVDGKPFMMLGGHVFNGTHLTSQLESVWPI